MSFKLSSEKKFFNFYLKSEIAASILIITIGACFALFMPHMIAKGGMVQAQDFIRLSPIFFPKNYICSFIDFGNCIPNSNPKDQKRRTN